MATQIGYRVVPRATVSGPGEGDNMVEPEAVARATSWTSVNTSGRKHKNLGFAAADAEKPLPLPGNLFYLLSNHLRGKSVKPILKAWSS